ncbi:MULTISPECIES: hypothetical protein [unclassified Mesorhizobium]|uniref:hypothetical protein n=1 Tax=Mesorhizobium sp. LNHC229A00 TaxID=1287240 RepID=UPI00041038F2|nr:MULTISPECIES: hypothetical protein [unclassified Mesorhizobium]
MTRVCEQVLVDRLRAPSTYKRIGIDHYSDPVPLEEFQKIKEDEIANSSDANWQDFQRRMLKIGIDGITSGSQRAPIMFKKYIRYDAANAYGTPIRDLSECTLLSEKGSESEATLFNVRVDGTTRQEYLIKLIKESNQN